MFQFCKDFLFGDNEKEKLLEKLRKKKKPQKNKTKQRIIMNKKQTLSKLVTLNYKALRETFLLMTHYLHFGRVLHRKWDSVQYAVRNEFP